MDPDARGGLLRVAPPSGARMFAVLGLLFAVALWIAVTQTVQVTASGRGVVRPSAGVFVVKAPVGGRVVSVAKQAGKTVAADAPLLIIEVDGGAGSAAQEPFADLLAKRRAQIAILERTGDEAAAVVLRQATAELEREAERQRKSAPLAKSRQVVVSSPSAGLVDALAVKPGDRVAVGAALAKVVPQGGRFVGRMTLAGRHRAQIDAGGEVRLRFDAYPSDESGFGKATIARISDDPMTSDIADPLLASLATRGDAQPAYVIELTLDSMPPRAEAEFQNGMSFTGEVVLREQRIITLLFPPLSRLLEPAQAE